MDFRGQGNGQVMRVVAVNGSPRAGEGATDLVVRRFLEGAAAAGAETEVLYPGRMKIAPCLGDLDCWFKHPGRCRHTDDMPDLAETLGTADLVVFASPVYIDTMTSQMKKFLDRLVAYAEPFVTVKDGRTVHPNPGGRSRKAVVVSVCGYPERENFDPISLTFRRICVNMHAELLGEFYFPAAHLIFTEPARIEPQLEAVEAAGREAVEAGVISAEVLERANADYVGDPERYVEWLNEMFHKIRKHFKAE